MYTKCAYLVTLFKIQPVPVGQYAKAHLLLFVSSRLALKSQSTILEKRFTCPAFMPAQLPCRKVVPPRAHARRCAWARWAGTGARSAFSSAVAVARRGTARRGSYGGCNVARQLWHGALASVTCPSVCSAASTVRRLQHGVARRLRHGVYGAAQCGAYCVCAARAHYSLLRVCKGHVLVCNATQIVSTSCTPTLFFLFLSTRCQIL